MPHLPPKQDQICRISEITSGIKRILEDAYPAVWVKGEISNLRKQSSGHLYFTLKDEGAQISAVMFRGNAMRLQTELRDGMEVVALGGVSVYEPRGTYQLIIRECLESGEGLLQAEFERLKRKLKDEGLFDTDRKKSIPILPRKVGIITSPSGAALRDFISILRRRQWTGSIFLFPAIVQGKEGAPDILKQLKNAQAFGALDLLVIGRGGGSLEDLWNFNDEAVTRAVADCTIPIVSAVGHEIDFVLTDFAADKRAETPSAAAELISSGFVDADRRLQQASINLKRFVSAHFTEFHHGLESCSNRLRANTPIRFVENRHIRLDELQERLRSYTKAGVQSPTHQLSLLEKRIASIHPARVVALKAEKLSQFERQLDRETQNNLQQRSDRLSATTKRLHAMNFENVLKRGYAVIRNAKDQLVTDSSKLKDGQIIRIHMRDGNKKAFIKDSEQLNLFSD